MLQLTYCQLQSQPSAGTFRSHAFLQVLIRHGADRAPPIPGPGHLATLPNHGPHSACFLVAVQIHILKADKAGDWWKFTVNIISVYKQGTSRIRRGDQSLWIRSRDIACKCPKIKPLKKYLLLGNAEDSPDQSGIVADKSSLVIQWRDTWARRLRKFQQREKKGKCKKA